MIKDAIGPEFGGTVGCLLFLSNTFGLAMYVLGCVEILQDWASGSLGDVNVRLLGTIVLGSLFAIVVVGISYISKASIIFMAGVVLSILSIYAGVIDHAIEPNEKLGIVGLSNAHIDNNLGPGYTGSYSFGAMLAIFFPAVTDPLAGSNLSGDLADPQKSIPPGTIAAVLTTTVVFCLQVLLVGGSCSRDALIADRLIVTRVAWPVEELVYVGMLMSTLGAGLQSLAGAPRLLASIAREGLIPVLQPFSPPDGEEPRRAVILCAFLSCCAVMLGSLNAVAPFITSKILPFSLILLHYYKLNNLNICSRFAPLPTPVWFLTCYGIINGACAFLAYEESPTFRPTFKWFDWRLSLFGAVQCFAMMIFCAPRLVVVLVVGNII